VNVEDQVISLNPTTAEPQVALGDDEVEMANVSPQLVKKWAAIAGRWKFAGKTAEYEGADQPGMANPLGLARASLRFRDGIIRTRIKLSRTKKTAAGLFFGFQAADSPYVMAQLGRSTGRTSSPSIAQRSVGSNSLSPVSCPT